MNYNLYAGAFLATVFVVMTLGLASDGIFHVEDPEVQGFAIEVPEGDTATAEVAEEEELAPITPLLASADAGAGEGVFRKCQSCHNVEAGAGNKVGPNLHNVVGRDIASVDDFGYSSALVAYGEGKQWTHEELNGFLLKPKEWVPGTSMGYNGLSSEDDRANLIAYLRANTDNPPAIE